MATNHRINPPHLLLLLLQCDFFSFFSLTSTHFFLATYQIQIDWSVFYIRSCSILNVCSLSVRPFVVVVVVVACFLSLPLQYHTLYWIVLKTSNDVCFFVRLPLISFSISHMHHTTDIHTAERLYNGKCYEEQNAKKDREREDQRQRDSCLSCYK